MRSPTGPSPAARRVCRPTTSLSVATFAVTRQSGVAATAATSGAVTGTLFAVSVTGVTVHLGTDGAQLDISGGSLDLYSFKTATLAWLAATGSGFGLTAVLGPVSITTSGVAFQYNSGPAGDAITNWAFAGGPSSLPADYVHVSGGSTSVTVTGLGSLSVSTFAVTRQTGVAATAATSGAVTGTLFSVSVTGVTVHLGTDGAQLYITCGNLYLYSFKTATLSWLATTGSGFGLTAVLGPVSISTSGVSFQYNSGPAGDAITNWAFAGGPSSLPADYVHVSGGSTSVTVTGLGSLSVSTFAVTRQTGVAATAATSGAVTGTLFSVSVTGVTVHLGADGAQLDITGGSLDLYSFKTATLSWLATTGSGFGLTAVFGPVSISTSGVSFQYNSGPAGDAITNWAFAGGPASLPADYVHVSGGSTTVTVTGLGSLSVSTFAVTRQTGVAAAAATSGGGAGAL